MSDKHVYDFLAQLEGLHGGARVEGYTPSAGYRPPYDAASITKMNQMWQPGATSSDGALFESWDLMNARIRDAVRNDPILSKTRRQLVRLTVGSGIYTFAAAKAVDGTAYDDFNNESDTWFERWAENEADFYGELSWWDMQALSFGETVEVGNNFLIEMTVPRRNRTSTLSYQLVELEQLALDLDEYPNSTGNYIKKGIEYNSKGQKVAYHFYDAHPYDTHQPPRTKTTRIPAGRVIHNHIKPRPSATFGISWFAALVLPSRDMDWLLGNELTSAAVAALLTVVHRSKSHGSHGSLDVEEHRNNPFRFGHAVTSHIDKDDDIEVVESKRPNKNMAPFIELMLARAAMASGLSMNRLMGDPSKANLAAIKAAHQDDARLIEPLQKHQALSVACRVRRAHTANIIGHGLMQTISASQFARQRFQWDALEWVAPGSNEVQADKDGEATIDRLRSGISTFPIETGARGRHWKRTIDVMAEVNKYAQDKGVVLDWTKGQGVVPDSATSIAGDEQESEADDEGGFGE